MSEIVKIQEEIKNELANPEVLKALVATTFKGLNQAVIPQAITEGMIRGFKFKDFLEKNIYAIPYGNSYSLVTSIDYARKIGMRSGVVGKSAPSFESDENGKVIACTVTIKKIVEEHIGEFTETVYFNEYSTGRNLWTSKPRTMIAKVAEMHALRMACPEELSQAYVEEEFEKEDKPESPTLDEAKIAEYKTKLESAKTLRELNSVWSALPIQAKNTLENFAREMKAKLSPKAEEKKTEKAA